MYIIEAQEQAQLVLEYCMYSAYNCGWRDYQLELKLAEHALDNMP